MSEKSYIVAPRSGARDGISPQWIEELHGIPGVKVRAANAEQARISADEVGIRTLRAKLTRNFLVEEEFVRSL
jgi:hypothetical protein